MELDLLSNWKAILVIIGCGFLIFCFGIAIGIVYREVFVKDVHPSEEDLYFPPKKVDNKNV